MLYPITPFSFEGRVTAFLAETNMSIASFAALLNTLGVRVSQTNFSTALNGRSIGLGAEALREIEPVFAQLKKLVADVRPLVLDLRNPAIVAEWLQAMADGELSIVVTNSNTAAQHPTPGTLNPAQPDAPLVAGVSDGRRS
jgi:hypothetical protein